ncbi:MAG: DUF882 domain-containing protein [Gammaproteobacteria bacterium]|nr:DUF882 domain-containing protein [Gammaproteobacteria bacterium]NDE86228.1 DUF882 domain-containing protein [Gammaproteobacteria bacterium]
MPERKKLSTAVSRRSFFFGAAAAGVALLADGPQALARTRVAPLQAVDGGWLELFNTHTAESLQVVYRSSDGLVTSAVDRLQWLLRDHRSGEAAHIDVGLYDQLTALAAAARAEPRFEVISGYRSPQTNASLHAAGRGVATRSLHMQGRAIDVRLRGVSTSTLRDFALAAGRGGVGYYRRSDFVHIDTGRVRHWAG